MGLEAASGQLLCRAYMGGVFWGPHTAAWFSGVSQEGAPVGPSSLDIVSLTYLG